MPQSRFLRFLLCFTAVLAAYWAYALFAVPLIEPSFKLRQSPAPNDRNDGFGSDRYGTLLDQLFPDGSWELQSPKILETDQGLLLFKDYEPLPNGRLHVKPFTVVFHEFDEASSDSKDEQRAIVLSAPAGAEVEFDEPFDQGRVRFGRLVSGDLKGDIQIRSPETSPGAGDALQIKTRDVHIGETSIKAPYKVSFRFGPHFGGGKDLTINLADADDAGTSQQQRARFGRARSLQLTHVDRLYFFLKNESLFPDAKDNGTRSTDRTEQNAIPVEVTCLGPLHYDFTSGVASLKDHVDVIKLNPNGSSDQLNGDRLELHFSQDDEHVTPATPLDGSDESPADKMKIRRIIAFGKPATLRAPSRSAVVVAQRMEFDFLSKRVTLHDGHEVHLQHERDDIRCPQLRYTLGQTGRLGALDAKGPGTFRRTDPNGRGEMFAKWERRLTIVPHEAMHVVDLHGNAHIEWPDSSFDAQKVRAWIMEVPRAAGDTVPQQVKYKIRPLKLEANGQVAFDTPKISGRTAQIDVSFEHTDQIADANADSQRENPPVANGSEVSPDSAAQQNLIRQRPSGKLRNDSRQQSVSHQKFHLTGNRVRARVLQRGDKSSVREVAVVGNVHLRETIVDQPNELPIDISGHLLHLVRDDRELARVQIASKGQDDLPTNASRPSSQHARVAARGLTITAAEVNLDQATNQVWVDGGGDMAIAAKQTRKVRPNISAGDQRADDLQNGRDESVISWTESMTFDGQVVRILGDVVGNGKRGLKNGSVQFFTSRSRSLNATLNQFVDFSREKNPNQASIDIDQLKFDGGVEMDSRTFDEARNLSAIEHVEAADLSVNYATGELSANGSGNLETVRRANRVLANRPGNRLTDNQKDADRLTYAHVIFQRAVEGNILQRRFDFHQGVEAVYGPVNDWRDRLDPNHRNGLGKDGVFMTCDKLTIAETSRVLSGRPKERPVEMIAEGRAYARGRDFESYGHRISMDESKESIVLEGNNREGARIFHQAYPGAPRNRLAAGKIYYSKKTGRVQWQDLTLGEVVQP